jgi:murein L,D-transpeptidase YafK
MKAFMANRTKQPQTNARLFNLLLASVIIWPGGNTIAVTETDTANTADYVLVRTIWGNTIAVTETDTANTADYVLVRKVERKLYLYRRGKILKTYRVALGKQPNGHKQRSGDSRTPEGLYTLDWRNSDSKFFRSIHVSYPSASDRLNAHERGDVPGGEIMIHGQPTDRAEKSKLLLYKNDWTEGCIAVQNHEMLEIWQAVKDGTPIEIIP